MSAANAAEHPHSDSAVHNRTVLESRRSMCELSEAIDDSQQSAAWHLGYDAGVQVVELCVTFIEQVVTPQSHFDPLAGPPHQAEIELQDRIDIFGVKTIVVGNRAREFEFPRQPNV